MSRRTERYRFNKALRDEGKYPGAPLFYSFPRLGEVVPVIPRGKQILTVGGSGTGKSHSVIALTIMPIYNLIKNHGYKAKIFIALLEDSLDMLEDRLFCRVLYTKTGIEIDPMELTSMKKKSLGQNILVQLDEIDAIVEDILSHCVVIDNVTSATGIYKWARTESAKLGTHSWKDKEFTYNKKDGNTYKEMVKVYDKYTPSDPEEHVILIIDNLNNLEEKKGDSVHEAIGIWCRRYGRLQITKHWGWTVWNIGQTALDTDKKQFTHKGSSIIEKLEPNLSSLGDNKMIGRDHSLIFGLFAPARFGIPDYCGYDISQLGDAYRALIILKSNFSESNKKLPLYFNGAVSMMKELPETDDMTSDVYKKVRKGTWK